MKKQKAVLLPLLVSLSLSAWSSIAQGQPIEIKNLPQSKPATISGTEYRCFDLEGYKGLVLIDQKLQLRETEVGKLRELRGSVDVAIDGMKISIDQLQKSIQEMGKSNIELADRASFAERRLQEELQIGFWDVAPWVLVAAETIAVVIVVLAVK